MNVVVVGVSCRVHCSASHLHSIMSATIQSSYPSPIELSVPPLPTVSFSDPPSPTHRLSSLLCTA